MPFCKDLREARKLPTLEAPCREEHGSVATATTLNNQSRHNHNGYGLDALPNRKGDPPAHSQPAVLRIQPSPLPFVLPSSGGSAGNDHDRGHKEPLYPHPLYHQFDEIPIT